MKRIAVWGIGAIGASVASRLEAAGAAPVLIARPATAEAIRAGGLINRQGKEEIRVRPRCVADPREAGPQDLVLIAVKAHAGPALAPLIAPLLEAHTAVVSLVNGLPWWYFGPGDPSGEPRAAFEAVDPGGAQWQAIGPARAIGAVARYGVHMETPNTVVENAQGHYGFGELDGSSSERVTALRDLFRAAGFASDVSANIRADVWLKLMGNISTGPVAALTRQTVGGVIADPDTRALGRLLMEESKAVAERLGVKIEMDIEQRLIQAGKLGAHKASMLQDVEAGRRLEVDAMVGAVSALGRRAGVATPTVDMMLALVRQLDRNLAG